MGLLDLFRQRRRSAPALTRGAAIDLTGYERVGAVGESHYQAELAALAGPKCAGGVDVPIKAVLAREPDNPYDRNAIAVYADGGGKVGYLAREDAVAYAGALAACGDNHAVACCDAVILGADARRDTSYCVWLHLQPPDWRSGA